jgi:hypothetical protein
MPYDPGDLRSQLTTSPATSASAAGVASHSVKLSGTPTSISPLGSHHWVVRSRTCVVVHSELLAGDAVERHDQPDEYMVLFTDSGAAATVTAGADERSIDGETLAVVPPGYSRIIAIRATTVVRIFSNESADLCAEASNASPYVADDPSVAPFAPWPEPSCGHTLRVYPMADVPADAQRFGRLFRCSTVMVNWFLPVEGPRDPAKLSPHHHDDFEQLSLQMHGDYVHHLRTAWTPNMAEWRDDEHLAASSPALTVITPPTIHTSQAVGDDVHELIDIFCPPRLDFSLRPGWILNADEYPMPC